MGSVLPFLVLISGTVTYVMANKMSDKEKSNLESQMESNKDKIAAMGVKFDSIINDLMISLKDEHAKGDVLKKFVAAHPNIDTSVAQSIGVVLTNSKLVDSKVTELLNKLDISKKLLNNGNDANLKCLQMIVNYSDESSDADYIKQICTDAQMSLVKAIQIFNDEQQLTNEVSHAQKLIMDSTNTFSNVQSIIDKFIQSNSNPSAPKTDPIDSYPTSSTIKSIQTQLPAIQPLSTPNTSPLPKDMIHTNTSTSLKDNLNASNKNNFSVDNINTNQATALPYDPVAPLPPPIDATGTPSLPLDGVSTVLTGNGQPIPTNAAVTPMTNDLTPTGKVNTLADVINSTRGGEGTIGANFVRDYTDEEYAILLERIRKSVEFQNNLIVRNRLYLSRFDEILTSINKVKEILRGAISSIPRVSVDYDQTILQFDKLTENSDDIERALNDTRGKLLDDVNLLIQLSQESKNCVDNLVVKSSTTYNKCVGVFNYWNDNSQRLQLDQNDAALFTRAEIINKSMSDMITSIKASGMFMNKDASDNETRDVPVAQSSDGEFVSELNGMKPLTQTEDVTQMANDANDLIKSILKEILYTETSFNNNYQIAQESQTEMEILSKNPEFSNPIHKNFFDECKQVLKNSQIIPNNNAIATKFFATNKDEINEITNDLTVCISTLTNMNEHSDDKKSVMEKCRQAASRTNKLNDVLKGDEFQNLITHMENAAKMLSQHAISMRTIAKADAPLAEPAINEISNDAKIAPDDSANGTNYNNYLRSSEVDSSALMDIKPSSTKILMSLPLIVISTIALI
ncbi:BmGPI1, B microti specific [Babesia microti strain RI]|uniref:BmGPI1, B microti specific n=1 Tax=Babesia microti (strain RI) TaxID=1133968 RepID=A0A1N6LWB4_BABMR|nr:BmGPI1, B microti specific [Babesia microti strain RI]SIO73165.1 BmGPI1, B microti specific [Babesia microti strain RI]|eukprot:XP_012647158.2 BmGPI1, B microti specific [Babesia microti strain RI]